MKILKIVIGIFIFSISNMLIGQGNLEQQMKRFQVIDTNGNEVITMDEMIAYYKDKKDKSGNSIDSVVVFHGMDENKNAIVTFQEFQKGINWREGKKIAKEKVEKLNLKKGKKKETKVAAKTLKEKRTARFKKIDTDNSKAISLNEMVAHYKGLKNKKGESVESDIIFYGLDKNKDNKVTLYEFLKKVDWKFGKQRVKSIKNKAD